MQCVNAPTEETGLDVCPILKKPLLTKGLYRIPDPIVASAMT